MTAEFLFSANLVLILRLYLHLTDEQAGAGTWGIKTGVELLSLFCFMPQGMLIAVGLTSVVMNTAGYWWDRRERDRNAGHLILGVLHLVLLSIFFSGAAEVRFRTELVPMAQGLAVWSTFGPVVTGLFDVRVLKLGFGLLLVANEANMVIRMILSGLHLKPGITESKPLDRGEYNRGRVIGLLERVLIYCFVLSGQFGAIGFTLAAKGFTRFKEMENRSFAEYVLIGTLLSSGLAMLIGILVKYALD